MARTNFPRHRDEPVPRRRDDEDDLWHLPPSDRSRSDGSRSRPGGSRSAGSRSGGSRSAGSRSGGSRSDRSRSAGSRSLGSRSGGLLPAALSRPGRLSLLFTLLVAAVALGMVLVVTSVGDDTTGSSRAGSSGRPTLLGRPPVSDAPPATAIAIGSPATATAAAGSGAGIAPPPFPKAGQAGKAGPGSKGGSPAGGGATAPAAAGAGASANGHYPGQVSPCGTKLCEGGANWQFYGASVFNDYDRPDDTAALAVKAKLDALRLTDFIDAGGSLDDATSDRQWRVVDAMIASAGQAGLHVEIDLSAYRNLLQNNDINPYTYDWKPFLSFLTSRVNTVSGRRYRDDPTIAMIALAGSATVSTGHHGATSSQITGFFARTLAELKQLDPAVVRASGGQFNLDSSSAVDWRTIMSNPDNQVCQVRVYNDDDRDAAEDVANYCADRNKPWMVEEIAIDQDVGDAERAKEFQSIADLVKQEHGAGSGFWNLGFEVLGQDGKKDTYDVNPDTPETFRTVQRNAP